MRTHYVSRRVLTGRSREADVRDSPCRVTVDGASCGVPEQTVAALREIHIDHVIPLHCTGEPFYDKARAEMPGKALRPYTGTRFVFS